MKSMVVSFSLVSSYLRMICVPFYQEFEVIISLFIVVFGIVPALETLLAGGQPKKNDANERR